MIQQSVPPLKIPFGSSGSDEVLATPARVNLSGDELRLTLAGEGFSSLDSLTGSSNSKSLSEPGDPGLSSRSLFPIAATPIAPITPMAIKGFTKIAAAMHP